MVWGVLATLQKCGSAYDFFPDEDTAREKQFQYMVWFSFILKKNTQQKCRHNFIFLFHSVIEYISKTDHGRKFESHCLFEISKIQTTMRKQSEA